MTNWHVEPVKDSKHHNTDNINCNCNPILEKQVDGSYIVVHRSYDRRENGENNAITKDNLA